MLSRRGPCLHANASWLAPLPRIAASPGRDARILRPRLAQERAAMTPETTQAVPTDRAKINLSEPLHVRFWCSELRCTEGQLRDAVRRVGTAVVRVEAFLR